MTDLTRHGCQWHPVPGFEGMYEVSAAGQIRSLDRHDSLGRRIAGKTLRPVVMKKGHLRVYLSRGGSEVPLLVHRVVLEAFVGPCPDGLEGCHNDGDPSNNDVANLRWDTRSSNRYDAVRHGVDPNASKTQCNHGHAFTMENTYRWRGRRHCRTCRADANMRRRRRRGHLKAVAS